VYAAYQSCPGNGVISTVPLFSVTIDRFVDPLPAPEVDPAVASALALAVIAARSVLRRARLAAPPPSDSARARSHTSAKSLDSLAIARAATGS